jgi:hypothetical protein
VEPDAQAAQLASGLGPEPFTVSRDVSFGDGGYQPGMSADDDFLAHELAHVHAQSTPGLAPALAGASKEKRSFVSRMIDTALPRLASGISVQRKCSGTELPQVDAERVEFQGSHAMTGFGDPKVKPVWTPGAADHAAAYTRGSNPVVRASFRLSKAVKAGTAVSVRVKENGAVRGQVNGVQPAGTSSACSVMLTGLTGSDKVGESATSLDWEVSADGKKWQSVGVTGPHTLYWLYADPRVALRNYAVKKAVGFAAGKADGAAVAKAIRTGIRGALAYDPADDINSDPLTVFGDGVGICTDFGNLLTLLALSVGLQANGVMFWGGFQSQGKNVWVTKAGDLLSLRNVKSPNPSYNPPSSSGWEFTYHVISRIEGTLHDAALDREGIDGEAFHNGKLVRLVEVDGSPPAAKKGKAYKEKVPRKSHPVVLTVRDYGQQVGDAEFGDVYPVGVATGAPSPVEVPVVWVLSSGHLPNGLTLIRNTGEIQGRPSKSAKGSYPLSITVSGPPAYGATIKGTFPVTLTVDK